LSKQRARSYWYRFNCGSAQNPIGRALTLPSPQSQPNRLRFGFVSCANFEHGYFSAYRQTASRTTGGGKWVEMTIPADPLYQHLLLAAERKFWRCVQNGEAPRLFGVEPPRPRIEAVRTVDMSGSNAWAEFANLYRLTRPAALDHDRAKTELKALVPEDAREAAGHGVRAKRSKSGAISFEVLELEASHAALQR
jgi:hypothetical protein